MLAVYDVVKKVFWNDAMFDRHVLPSEAALRNCGATLADLSTMTGKERVAVLQECNIDASLYPIFLRAVQHVTALHDSGMIDDAYKVHRHLSAHFWSPQFRRAPLLGYPIVNSDPYCDIIVAASSPTVSDKDKGQVNMAGSDRTAHGARYNGLLNQGATCYLNSLLQALFHISAFRAIIYNMYTKEESAVGYVGGGSSLALTPNGNTNMATASTNHATISIPHALQRLFCLMQTAPSAVSTNELTESFGWSAADSFTQHDVHEMTRVLLDNLQEKLKARQQSASTFAASNAQTGLSTVRAVTVEELFGEFDELNETNAYHNNGGDNRNNNNNNKTNDRSRALSTDTPANMTPVRNAQKNAIDELFNGVLESYIRVTDVDYYSAREEPFYDLQLVVKNTSNIYASLDRFFQVEKLEGKNKYCLERDGTKSYHCAERGVRLKKTPPILLFHLARFDYDLDLGEQKIFSRWDYYNTLDLAHYMTGATREETHYTLQSVLVHSGSNTGSGHYFCYVRCHGSWYKFNDEHVTPATLCQVFGDNFGGYEVNYWGTEVERTTNAYMLVYVRTSQMHTLLRPIDDHDLPPAIMAQLHREQAERERLRKERAEDHLYGRVRFVQPHEAVECGAALCRTRCRAAARQPSSGVPLPNTLRALLQAEAEPLFRNFAHTMLSSQKTEGDGASYHQPHQDDNHHRNNSNTTPLMWYAPAMHTDESTNSSRFCALVGPQVPVSELLHGRAEMCVLVTTPTNTTYLELDEDAEAHRVYELYHHKLYDPLQLRVIDLGYIVLHRCPDHNPATALRAMEPHVRQWIAALPDESRRFHGHHKLSSGAEQRGAAGTLNSCTCGCDVRHPCSSSSSTPAAAYRGAGGGLVHVPSEAFLCHEDPADGVAGTLMSGGTLRGVSYAAMHVMQERDVRDSGDRADAERDKEEGERMTHVGYARAGDRVPRSSSSNGSLCDASGVGGDRGGYRYEACTTLASGDTLVWQLKPAPEDERDVFYRDVVAFQHFLQHRIPVKIRLSQPPAYPVLVDTALASDMMYEQLQLYVARLIGESANYDRVRFTRHNPETGLPYYMKGKKKDRPTLMHLLTPATSRVTTLSKDLYYEFCKYTVTEMERSHFLQFKLYGDNVKPLSSHCVLMSREVPITPVDLFSACIRVIQSDYEVQPVLSPTSVITRTTSTDDFSPKATQSQEQFIAFVMQCEPQDAWKYFRLVDVWRSCIYNVLDRQHTIIFENQTFEESAEYRIERVPAPLDIVPIEQQRLLQIQHFTIARQRNSVPETHSEPFSMYVRLNESSSELLRRVAEKLELSYASVMDWKVCLVREHRVVAVRPDIPLGSQVEAFCDMACFQPNQKEPAKAAYIGLEHAPSVKRGMKREDKVMIFN